MLDVSFATSGTSTGRVIAYLQYAWCDSFAASGSCTWYQEQAYNLSCTSEVLPGTTS